jgi:hypothetical protein
MVVGFKPLALKPKRITTYNSCVFFQGRAWRLIIQSRLINNKKKIDDISDEVIPYSQMTV